MLAVRKNVYSSANFGLDGFFHLQLATEPGILLLTAQYSPANNEDKGGRVLKFDTKSGKIVHQSERLLKLKFVEVLKQSHDSSLLCISDTSGKFTMKWQLVIVDTATLSVRSRITHKQALPIKGLPQIAFSPNHSQYLAIVSNHTLTIYDTSDARLVVVKDLAAFGETGTDRAVCLIEWHESGIYLVDRLNVFRKISLLDDDDDDTECEPVKCEIVGQYDPKAWLLSLRLNESGNVMATTFLSYLCNIWKKPKYDHSKFEMIEKFQSNCNQFVNDYLIASYFENEISIFDCNQSAVVFKQSVAKPIGGNYPLMDWKSMIFAKHGPSKIICYDLHAQCEHLWQADAAPLGHDEYRAIVKDLFAELTPLFDVLADCVIHYLCCYVV